MSQQRQKPYLPCMWKVGFCQHVHCRERLNKGPGEFQALQRFHESNVLAAKIAEVFRPKVCAWASLQLCHGKHAVQKHGYLLLMVTT